MPGAPARPGEARVEIALLDWGGSGPLALLHHANGFCAGVWSPVARALRERFHVVALDARGHGHSTKPAAPEAYGWDRFPADLLAVARALAAEDPHGRIGLAIGHSFGGTATLAAAGLEPGLFERLLLVDPVILAAGGATHGGHAERRKNLMAARARRRRSHWPSREAALAVWRRRVFFEAWHPAALALYAEEGLRRRGDGEVELACSPETEATIFEGNGAPDLFALAARVTADTRFLWARQGSFSREVYLRLAATMRAARVEDADAGHLVAMERPELVVEAALRLAAAQPSTG